MNIETSIGLPGGWHYVDPQGYRIPHKGELPGAKEVIEALLQYRLENNIPVGDPEADLDAYVCSTFPTWCRPKDQILPPPNPPGTRPVDRVVGWANGLYKNTPCLQLVPAREAEARAEICARCPFQVTWTDNCPNCVTSAQRLLTILRQGRDVRLGPSGRLQGCVTYGWDNRTACHLDAQHLPLQRSPAVPPECWVGKPSTV